MAGTRIHFILVTPLVLSTVLAKDKNPRAYPLHGTVVAMRTELLAHGTPVYTDPYGKTHGGIVRTARVPVYTVRTPSMDYEIEGRRERLSIGDQLDFRCEKEKVFVIDGIKERKFLLVGQQIREAEPRQPQR